MIKHTFGLDKEPFLSDFSLLKQQQDIADVLHIHAQHGGVCVVLGDPGVGKTVLLEHLEALNQQHDYIVASMSMTMHTYGQIIKHLAQTLSIEVKANTIEKELIEHAHKYAQERKKLLILIDEAHLLAMDVLRKLRLLFSRFPKRYNLILLGQPTLMQSLSMTINEDLKSRVTYSARILPLNDDDLQTHIIQQLGKVNLSANTFDENALALITRHVQGNLRLCRHLCYGSLVEACRENKKIVNTDHVNAVLVQPHWRTYDELISMQAQ